MTRFHWSFGDRDLELVGRTVRSGGPPLRFTLQTPPGAVDLTLELREFRTVEDSLVAYVVEVDGRAVAFRNRAYFDTGPTTAFIDLPAPSPGGRGIHVQIRSLAEHPISFSEAVLYSDLEAFARRQGLVSPLYVGPTAKVDRDRLTELKSLLPQTAEVRPMFVVPTFAIAQWPGEVVAQKLDELLRIAAEIGMPVELQLNTWWAGTPSGCDGADGRWYDPTYQQVTYSPASGQFDLSVPNHWSSTPWLTTRNERLNRFKASCFRTVGQLLREHAAAAAAPLPILSLVVDNEPTYWGAGNPDTPPDLEADFNPSIVAAASRDGVKLDPRDGLSDAEMQFLRGSLRSYNRAMIAGLREGLGEGPLARRVYTHTFMRGWCFKNPIQATRAGTLRDARMGGEWERMTAASLSILDEHRELGIPAGINDERSNGGGAAPDVQFAYATGCDHLSLFNISDEGLREITASISKGWQSFPPVAARQPLLSLDFSGDNWRRWFVDASETRIGVIWPGPQRAMYGSRLGESSRALVRLTSREIAGSPHFGKLALVINARSFVNRQAASRSHLGVSAGRDRRRLRRLAELHDFNGERTFDLGDIANGAAEVYVELEFHPLGLIDWTCLYGLRLEMPWDEERLLASNRSYRADRLRCESSLTAWRAEATWALQRVRRELSSAAQAVEQASIKHCQALLKEGCSRQACEAAWAVLDRHAAAPLSAWNPPSSEREERGEVRSSDAVSISIDPYKDGCMGRRLEIAPGSHLEIEENGSARTITSLRELLPGDDVAASIRNDGLVRLTARRGRSEGRVRSMTPTTPFALPTLAIEGSDARPVSSVASVSGRSGPERGSCWLRVGALPFQVGDRVEVRWNPHTGRAVEVKLLQPAG